MDLEKVAADSKRIAEKLQELEHRAGQRKLQNRSPSTTVDMDPKNSQILCGWREDEDDRYSSEDYSFRLQRRNHVCDDNREMMRAVLNAFFKTDHDAAQFEQYKLENDLTQPAEVRKAVSHLKAFVNSGLRVFLTVLFIIGAGSAGLRAQELKAQQALKIGDKVPNITIQNIINYPSATAKISDFKGKLLILDFWATWCGSCISKFAKTDSLQRDFDGRLQFLLVNSIEGTGDSLAKVKTFLEKWEHSKAIKLSMPFAVEDSITNDYFPRVHLPHYVWIGPDGRVKAITGSREVNRKNILAALEWGIYDMPRKLK